MNQILKDIGEELKAARESKGAELTELSTRLKIRSKYLKALESGEVDELPVSAYVVGYLKNYAKELGLDPDEVASRYRERHAGEANTNLNLNLPQPPKEGMRPPPVILIISIVIAVSILGYYKYSLKHQVYSDTAAQTSQNVTTESNASVANPGVSETPANKGQEKNENSAESVTQSIRIDTLRPLLDEGSHLVLVAKGNTWIQLLDVDNQFLLEKKLHPGDSYEIPDQEGLVLRAGDEDSIEVYEQGRSNKLLGILNTFVKVQPKGSAEVPVSN